MEREDPKALDYIDGIAIHYYGNFFPAQVLSDLHFRYPGKILLSTEACEGKNKYNLILTKIIKVLPHRERSCVM
jgi:O-glycosyl hydrolase